VRIGGYEHSGGNVHCKDLEINAGASATGDKNLKCKAASEAFDKKPNTQIHTASDTNTDREKYLLLLPALQPQ